MQYVVKLYSTGVFQNFPSLRVHPSSDGRSGSDRVNLLSKYGLNGFTATSQNFYQQNVKHDLLGSLFLPVYSQDSYVGTSDFKVHLWYHSVCDFCLVGCLQQFPGIRMLSQSLSNVNVLLFCCFNYQYYY